MFSQGLQFITGLALVRWLSYEAYAQYGMVLGFQNMLALLVDLGFTGSILALVGSRVDDPVVVGRYMGAAVRQRKLLLLLFAPLSFPFFLWYGSAHGWPLIESVVLFGSIVAFLLCQGWVSIYSPPLLMRQHLACLYRPSVILSGSRLVVLKVLHWLGALGAAAACWIGALVSFINARLYRAAAAPYFKMPAERSLEAEGEMRRYISPLIAGMVFYAFHGQIQIFLIAVFGTTKSIAEVAALGRLGQVFVFVSSFISTILVPFIARLPLERVAVRYAQVVAGLLFVGAGISVVAFLFPKPLLWLLGAKYAGLQLEVGLNVTAAALSTISGAIYAFNNARKWIFHLTAVTSIGGLLIIEGLMIAFMDLSTTHSMMVFAVVTSAYPLIPFLYAGLQGYRRSLREARAAAAGNP